ncbi:MAG: tetratricopeptide repeat protein, partial [Candidatus Thermoplasmatota archaeon]
IPVEVPVKPAPEVALKPAPIPVEVPVKPAPEVALKPPPARVEEPEISFEVSEDELPKVHLLGSRYIDFVVMGDVIALVAVFAGLGMYHYTNLALWKLLLLFSIAGAGVLITALLFRISTSLVAEGDRHLKEGRFEEAIARYNLAVRLETRPAEAWTSKGVALKRLGRYDDALLAHNMALKLQPRNEVALCNKGDLLFRVRKYEDALKCYERAIEIRPKYAVAWNNKAIALAMLGRLQEAKEAEDIATKMRPSYAAAWINKGRILVRLGRPEEARLCYQRGRTLALP